MSIYTRYESSVRSYCRDYATTFDNAKGDYLYSNGNIYLDFLSGCGSLNYGHNPDVVKDKLIEYINKNGITHSMDCHTVAKENFIRTFVETILQPRKLDYKLQFPGPTGTNAVEAAVKLARKVTGRTTVVSFTNGFHGCTMGALALTGSESHRAAVTPLLSGVQRHYYDGYFGTGVNTAEMLQRSLNDPSSGFDKPAAIIVETVQGEGGLIRLLQNG